MARRSLIRGPAPSSRRRPATKPGHSPDDRGRRPSRCSGGVAPSLLPWARRRWWALYLFALAASHLVQWLGGPWYVPPPEAQEAELSDTPVFVGVRFANLPGMDPDGPVPDKQIDVAYLTWSPRSTDRPPVLLLHGSPGQAHDFARLAPLLAGGVAADPPRRVGLADPLVPAGRVLLGTGSAPGSGGEGGPEGYRVIAPDLPGFGNSTPLVPCYSNRAHALAMLALMDELQVDRVHVVGWSNGGGIAIHMADLAPDRLASMTLLAATGAQHTEGSGNYYFEHFKYGLGYIGLVLAPELIPHFGLLADRGSRHAFIRSFWDTDLRDNAEIMARIATPTLILHGRDDPLVSDWAAEEHHRILPASRLVMLDASHFLPFLQPDETAGHLLEFFHRHDPPGVRPLTDRVDLAPPRPDLLGQTGDKAWRAAQRQPWWIAALTIALFTAALPWTTLALAGLAVGAMRFDLGLAAVGLIAGRALRRRRAGSSRWWAGLLLGTPALLLIASLMAPAISEGLWRLAGPPGTLLGIVVTAFAVVGVARVPMLLTWRGRRRFAAGLTRLRRHEYWPTWLIYLPLIPTMIRLARRHRAPLAFTACNPAIEAGGGIVGESKARILRGLEHAGGRALPARLIDPDPSPRRRAERVMELIETRPELGGLPIVLKPDTGQRGSGVRLARTPGDVLDYFLAIPAPVIAQRYHPGPHECGILWCRHPQSEPRPPRLSEPQLSRNGPVPPTPRPAGFIFAIVRKEFPVIVGDGRRTAEQLIWAHPRHACQADVFLNRLGQRRKEVLPPGRTLRLAQAGNHAQGTLFRDGSDLYSPELERVIDEISAGFPHPEGGGLDVGRYDLRYESEQLLRRGEGFGILELNGTSGEPTNIYDPDRPFLWAHAVMRRHWSLMYELGAQRIARGQQQPLTPRQLLAMLRAHRNADPLAAD